MFEKLFAFQVSPLELVIRGSLLYWFIFLMFRFVLRRDTGSMGLADIIVVVIVADAAQNGMTGDYKTVSEAFLLVATIGVWNRLIDWMAFHFPWFSRFVEPRPISLILDGKPLPGNLRRELINQDELESRLRVCGFEEMARVKRAVLEPGGTISVIGYEGESSRPPDDDRQPPR